MLLKLLGYLALGLVVLFGWKMAVWLLAAPRDRAARRIEANLRLMERGLAAEDWAIVALCARQQRYLLLRYRLCEGAAEEHLGLYLKSRGVLKLALEPGFAERVGDELFKRGLQPL